MTKAEYLSRFSRALKWRMSYQEAEEVIHDYEELFDQNNKREEEFCRELGNPVIAAGHLKDERAFQSWLVVFGIQLLPIAIVSCLLFSMSSYNIVISSIELQPYLVIAVSFLGIAVSFWWFRPRKEFKDKKLSKGIVFLLIVLYLFAVSMVLLTAYFFHRLFYIGVSISFAKFFVSILKLSGIILALLGIFAIVKSRICERRYRAVYILAVIFLLIIVFFFQVLTSMDFFVGNSKSIFLLLAEEFRMYAIIGGAGILASGAALC